MRRFAVLLLIPLFVALPGCDMSDLRPGATSILDLNTVPSPQEAAQWAIDPWDANNRYRGTLLLANAPFAGEPVYIKLFEDNIHDTDPGVRAAAARALANHGSAEHIPLLIAALHDKDIGVRTEAARGLQRLHSPDAVEPLIGAIDPGKEPEPAVRAQAAEALGQYPEFRVVEALIAALDDPNLAVNRATLASLRTLTGQDLGFDRGEWVRWYNASQAVFAAGGLYVYPVYHRNKFWYEYLPFVPPPPNEEPSTPAGMPMPGVQ